MPRTKHPPSVPDKIPFKIHPRAFAALGADLVTNDVVAVVELVKNSYDAWATGVTVRFGQDGGSKYLEVLDNGVGMSKAVLADVWCVVATPFKQANPHSKLGDKIRRVSGEKGLGRLSVARLGERLRMWTKEKGRDGHEVFVDWSSLAQASDLAACTASISRVSDSRIATPSGTLLRIEGLRSKWDEDEVEDLANNLGRLISPFENAVDFHIHLSRDVGGRPQVKTLEPPEFILNPTYRLRGEFRGDSSMHLAYEFQSRDGATSRTDTEHLDWHKIVQSVRQRNPNRDMAYMDVAAATCGCFSFEIRAWDLDAAATEEISEQFSIGKTQLRDTIRAHKGISIYRDGILVLPKSDKARDWLGLDLRRVSKYGLRLSTSQIVGQVAITADGNPGIQDTSDRERLASVPAVDQFSEILLTAVGVMENQRSRDKETHEDDAPRSFFEEMGTEDLAADVAKQVEDGATPEEIRDTVRTYTEEKSKRKKKVERRWAYYRQLASVGTIGEMIVHEVRNTTGPVDFFVDEVVREYDPLKRDVDQARISAVNSLQRLESFADKFLPLANRRYRAGRTSSNLADEIAASLSYHPVVGDIKKLGIVTKLEGSLDTRVKIDPGHLQIILLNLLTNACYWLSGAEVKSRTIRFRARRQPPGRVVTLLVEDSGPGIRPEDVERVMLPGVTRKPDGLGMGLALAGLIAADNGGKLAVEDGKGSMGGASFRLDLKVAAPAGVKE
jgi:signal transduction histidine kinase